MGSLWYTVYSPSGLSCISSCVLRCSCRCVNLRFPCVTQCCFVRFPHGFPVRSFLPSWGISIGMRSLCVPRALPYVFFVHSLSVAWHVLCVSAIPLPLRSGRCNPVRSPFPTYASDAHALLLRSFIFLLPKTPQQSLAILDLCLTKTRAGKALFS